MSLCPEEDDIPWDSLRDNRDLTVLVSWNPRDRYVALTCRTNNKHAVINELFWFAGI